MKDYISDKKKIELVNRIFSAYKFNCASLTKCALYYVY